MNFSSELLDKGNKTPAFSISIEGRDITTVLDNRLIGLTLTDNRGFEADQLDLELDDADGKIVLPRRGAVITLALGWKGQPLFPKGAFTVDEIEHTGAPDRLTIRARSADFRETLNTRREKSWHNTTIGEVVKEIAARHKLKMALGKELSDNLFDLDQLRMEYSPDEYQNLLMCEFVDDLASVFPLSELQACMVDSWEVWTDFHALALRPFGWREVWIGYDPAKGTQNGDSAGCVVVAPPAVPGGKFRILERHQWRGMDFRAQADAIKKLTEQYNVTYIGIDSTGVGHGVYENVKAFFPAVREFVYNPNVKNALVLKAYDIISHRRLEFDAGHTDIAQSFMAIRRATTASGNRPTYEASRSEEASHADLAWATMHALFNEPLQGESANTSNIVEIF